MGWLGWDRALVPTNERRNHAYWLTSQKRLTPNDANNRQRIAAHDLNVPDGPLAGNVKTLASAIFVRQDAGWQQISGD